MLLAIVYFMLQFMAPPNCNPTEYQVFIDTDYNDQTGYNGYEFVVRGIMKEPALDLRDWAEIQNKFNETLELYSLAVGGIGTIIRHTLLGAEYTTPVPRGGWGRLAGFALVYTTDKGSVLVWLPNVFDGRHVVEFYEEGVLCLP